MSLKPLHTATPQQSGPSDHKIKLVKRAQAALAEARENNTVEVITAKDGTQFLSVKMKP